MAAATSVQLSQELGSYLLRHHARQQELPLDVGTVHRRIQRRCAKDRQQQQQAYPVLCTAGPEALSGAMQQLADSGCVKVERLTAGPKTLAMLTWVGERELARILGAWEGPAGGQQPRAAAATAGPGQRLEQQEQRRQQQEQEAGQSRSPLRKKLRTTTDAGASEVKQETVADILGKPTALEALAAERFKKHAPAMREFCQHRTKTECDVHLVGTSRLSSSSSSSSSSGGGGGGRGCAKLHFRRVIETHTDVTLGDCAYLSTCRRTRTCKYIHYEIEEETTATATATAAVALPAFSADSRAAPQQEQHQLLQQPAPKRLPAQWVNTDVRAFDLSVLGQFAVIMADPPWEIHMDLPYGTMADDDVCKLNFPKLQERDCGLLFLWVTGRAMERAREVFDHWGYHQVEEIVWIKTNQLQKAIRTGRTGHWLNHSKEHCLVGVKGQPRGLNRYLDCDVIVAEARETSRKPDEIYDIIERLSPGTRKVEIFGRRHNIRDGWVTVGNQLPPTRLVEPDVVARYQSWQQAQQQQRQQQRQQQQQQQARV